MKKEKDKNITIESFINSPKVVANLQKLKAAFSPGIKEFIISDTLDAAGHQYVNLVQKGGGVLGVALVGYTYILEQMGIRFLRLAGTSAGAINTAMLAVVGNKQDEKSGKVLDAVIRLNFFDLVDGHPIARWLIKRLITHQGYAGRLKKILIGTLIFYIVLFIASFIGLWMLQQHPALYMFTKTIVITLIIITFLLGDLVWLGRSLLQKLKNSGYGISKGDFFYNWMKEKMQENNVNTVNDLRAKAEQAIPGLHLRQDNPENLNDLKGDVTFITSELVTENKIEFPKMCHLFRTPDTINELHPAGFVRASMSIPVFFESYFIGNIPYSNEAVKAAWLETFGETTPPPVARFVDGGILSNFPISIFYNPKIHVPRLPTFGIDLNDENPEDKSNDPSKWSFSGYFLRIFNTIRNYYDKDFQLKNKVYSKGIGIIPLAEFNWLNFFLTDAQKLAMFEKGADAATAFLLKFDWEGYKNDRAFMQASLEQDMAK